MVRVKDSTVRKRFLRRNICIVFLKTSKENILTKPLGRQKQLDYVARKILTQTTKPSEKQVQIRILLLPLQL